MRYSFGKPSCQRLEVFESLPPKSNAVSDVVGSSVTFGTVSQRASQRASERRAPRSMLSHALERTEHKHKHVAARGNGKDVP